jgi:hypothetical protein
MKKKKISSKNKKGLEEWVQKKLSLTKMQTKLFLLTFSIATFSSSFVLMNLALENYGIVKTSNAETFQERIQNTKTLNFSYEQNQ